MSDTITTLALGITLEQLANLEEEHHKDSLRKFRLCPRQEADAKSTDGGDGHQEMLIKGIAFHDTLPSLMQCLVAY